MADETEGKKKGGFFRKLFKITAVLAAIGETVRGKFWEPLPGAGLETLCVGLVIDVERFCAVIHPQSVRVRIG